jgi:hypothetical protein
MRSPSSGTSSELRYVKVADQDFTLNWSNPLPWELTGGQEGLGKSELECENTQIMLETQESSQEMLGQAGKARRDRGLESLKVSVVFIAK